MNKQFEKILSEEQTEDLKNGEIYIYRVNGKKYIVVDGEYTKIVHGLDYNYVFDKKNGDFARWGVDFRDDPDYSPLGPEILDLEISVNGCPNRCNFCYKGNTNAEPKNMTFDTFKTIIDKFNKSLTQVAFGITGIKTNPDFLKMMKYCREIGIVPNFTLSGIDLDDKMAKDCAEVIGAVAVSAYESDKNVCYDTVKKFTDLGVKQTNIHLLVSSETLDFVYEVLKDRQEDPRLSGMNAIVFLGVKPKGRAVNGYHSLSVEKYSDLIEYCIKNDISIGFDSCSAPKFELAVHKMDMPETVKESFLRCSESCESSLFSAYVNVSSEYWHCSFAEDEENESCVNVIESVDFLDTWYSKPVIDFRRRSIDNMIDGCRHCHVFPSINPQ